MDVRIGNLSGRAVLLGGGRALDIASASDGRFGPGTLGLLADWSGFLDWARAQTIDERARAFQDNDLGPCIPDARQVFAIGLNYKDHAEEAGLPIPNSPMVFTKFPSCLAGPRADVPLTSDTVDWEVELVVVVGSGGSDIAASRAMEHVAGYCVGQDISDRRLQFSDKPPQFSLGKSAPAFGPIGPALVPIDEIAAPHDLAIRCDVGEERMQESRTSQLIYAVPELVEYISARCPLLPGDLIFTGTPGGVGSVRDPRRYLKEGEVIRSEIEGLGELSNRCVARA